MADAQQEAALDAAEEKIRAILMDLVTQHGLEIEEVRVDTRQFSRLNTEIFVKE